MTESTLNLLASLVSHSSAAGRIDRAAWPSIVDLALQHGLGPMLLWQLKQTGSDKCLPPPLGGVLLEAARRAAIAGILFEKTLKEVNAALQTAYIPALWLKGAALAHSVYPEPALRPMGDLDVLIPYEQRERALGVVRDIGYDFYPVNSLIARSRRDELTLRLSHHYHLKSGGANSVILELHFRLLGQDDRLLPLDRLRWFWEHTHCVRLEAGTAFDTLTPEAHLVYLCAHALLQHGEAQLHLLRFFDLHQIITQTAVDWNRIVNHAVVLGWTAAVARALELTMAYFATPVPETVFAALVSQRPAYEDVSRVTRLSGAGNRWERVRGKLSDLPLREKVAYMRLIAFPPRAYMRQRYTVKAGAPVWPYYFCRWYDQGRDMAWAIWKHLTGQYR